MQYKALSFYSFMLHILTKNCVIHSRIRDGIRARVRPDLPFLRAHIQTQVIAAKSGVACQLSHQMCCDAGLAVRLLHVVTILSVRDLIYYKW